MVRGIFFSFEGGEGCGKSTQLELVRDAFNQHALPYIATREPGGPEFSEHMRDLLLHSEYDLPWQTEFSLILAARSYHVQHTILPALVSGRHVLCDRFSDSTRAYQSVDEEGNFLDDRLARINAAHDAIIDGFLPDRTYLFDVSRTEGFV